MSSLPNFPPLLVERSSKLHHATSLLIASELCFALNPLYLPRSNRDHVEYALAQEGVALDTFYVLPLTFHHAHFASFRLHRCTSRLIDWPTNRSVLNFVYNSLHSEK